MSYTHLVNVSEQNKKDLFVKNATVDNLLVATSINCNDISSNSLITGDTSVGKLIVQDEIYDKNDIVLINDGLVFDGSSPANFVNLNVIINTKLNLHYSKCLINGLEKDKLKIYGGFEFQCGISPLQQNAIVSVKLTNVPIEFQNSTKISAKCQVYNTAYYGNQFAVSVVDTSTANEITVGLWGRHDTFNLNEASYVDFSLSLVKE